MKMKLIVSKAFLRKDYLLEKRYFVERLISTLAVSVFVAMFYFIASMINEGSAFFQNRYNTDYLSFVFVGVVFIWYFYYILNSFAADLRLQASQGILEAILSAPAKPALIFTGMNLWNILICTTQMFLFLILGKQFLNIQIVYSALIPASLVIACSFGVIISLGVISVAVSMSFGLKRDPVIFITHCVTSLLCGVYFPVSFLPDWLQKTSSLIPITYLVRALRMTLIYGHGFNLIWQELLTLFSFSIIMFIAALKIFDCSLNKLKQKGRALYE